MKVNNRGNIPARSLSATCITKNQGKEIKRKEGIKAYISWCKVTLRDRRRIRKGRIH